MKVAIVCPYAWNRFGGVQTHVKALASSLEARGHEVDVIAPKAGGEHTVDDDVTIVGRSVAIPVNGSVAPLAFGPLTAAGVRRALEELAPDVVQVHEPFIPSLSLLALQNAEAPTIGTFHAAAESSFGYWAGRPMLAKAAGRLTLRTAVSQEAATLVSRYFPGDYRLTPNGVDIATFSSAARADLGRPHRVLFFGRLERRKGLDVLIEAMTLLRDLDVRVVVAGTGPEERMARFRARRWRIDARFLGRVADEDKARVYRSADVYCAPALGGESFGIVLVEAMAAGTPVVCSDLPAFGAVTGDAALRVPPDEPGALADALRAVLTSPATRAEMSARGRAVAAGYDWANLAGGVEAIYEEALRA